MIIKNVMLIVGVMLGMTGCVSTQSDMSVGNTPYALANDNENPTKMGVRYLLGRGVPQNDREAFAYFKEAANEDDDPFAENELGYLYAAGKGTARDNAKAFHYYQLAANHGLSSAEYNLGFFYANGIGTEQNLTLAKQWYEKSASRGFEPAKRALLQLS